MKKYLIRIGRCVLVSIFFAATVFPVVAFAADELPPTDENIGFHEEADGEPQLSAGGAALLTASVTAPGMLEMQMNILEGLFGIGSVELSAVDAKGQTKTLNAAADNITGEGTLKTLHFAVDKTFVKGEYEIREIRIFDTEHNCKYYTQGAEWPFGELRFTVTESESDDDVAPVLKSVTVKTPEISAPGTLELDMGILEEGVGVKYISVASNFWWKDFYFTPDTVLKGNGDPQTISFPVPTTIMESGYAFHIVSINICDNNGNMTRYTKGTSGWLFGDLNYKLAINQKELAPTTIGSATVNTPEVSAPGTLDLTMKLQNGPDGNISSINLEIIDENGQRKNIYSNNKTFRGDGSEETASFIVDSALAKGEYRINSIWIFDTQGRFRNYICYNAPDGWPFGDLRFTITEAETEDNIAPDIKSLNVKTSEVSAPGTLELDLGILEEGVGVIGYG